MNLGRKIGHLGLTLALLAGGLVIASGGSPVAAAGTPVQPVISSRLADTRSKPAGQTVDGLFVGIGRRPAGTETKIQITGRGGVPVGASAAVINLTSVQPAELTFLTAYPCGTARPNASNVNSPAYVDRANSVFVKLNAEGMVCIYNEKAGDFLIDVNGYVPATGSPTAVNPARFLDTRRNHATIDGQFSGKGRPTAKSTTEVQITGRGGVPLTAKAVVLNLTAERPSGLTVLTAFPCDGIKPETVSSLNLPAGDTRANSVFVQLSGKGAVCIYTSTATDIIIDVSGYVDADEAPLSVAPVRLADSRPKQPTIDGKEQGFGRRGPESVTPVQITGRGGVPVGATAALINLTAENPTAGTYLTAYPCDGARPDPGSNLNLPAGDTGANGAFVKLSATGTVCIYTVASTDVIVDINGYVTSPPAYTCPASGSIPSAECAALVALYDTNNGVNWKRPNVQMNWLTSPDPCGWIGVTCSGGHVTTLDLRSMGLSGPLAPQIGNLTSLASLSLQSNRITGLPADIGKLTKVADINLSQNQLTSLPAQIGDLISLTSLSVADNQLTSLPTEFSKLSKLTTLGLGGNQLAALPTAIASLTNLETLDLGANKFTAFPVEVTSLVKLKWLIVADNAIKSIPKDIGKLINLEQLEIDNDQLTTLPIELTTLTKLRMLDVSRNQLAGLPIEIGNLTRLENLQAANNVMAGDISAVFTPLMVNAPKLSVIALSGNKCLTTSNPTLAAWLTTRDPKWNSGC